MRKVEQISRLYTQKKVERIVTHAYAAFRAMAAEYGTLSADEILACTINLAMAVSAPLGKMSNDPAAMRREVAKQIALMIEKGSEEVN